MNAIQVFDPALCCNTGVCGVDVDQALVSFSADIAWAKENEAQIERFNLAQQPMASRVPRASARGWTRVSAPSWSWPGSRSFAFTISGTRSRVGT